MARLEARVTELEGLLAAPELYDGTAAAAKRSAELGREPRVERAALAAALATWTSAVEAF